MSAYKIIDHEYDVVVLHYILLLGCDNVTVLPIELLRHDPASLIRKINPLGSSHLDTININEL